MTAQYSRDAMSYDALNICLQSAEDIPTVKGAMRVVDHFANGFRTSHSNLASNVAKGLRKKYAFLNRPAFHQSSECNWTDRRAALEAVHESYDVFLKELRKNRFSCPAPVMAGIIMLDLTTSLLEPIMLAKDEGQDIRTTLACYEAATKTLRSWCKGDGGGSADIIMDKALSTLGRKGRSELKTFKDEHQLFMRNLLQHLEHRFGGHGDKLATLENILPFKVPTVSFATIREAVFLCIECGVLRRSHNVVQTEFDAWKQFCSTLEHPEKYDVKQTLQMCPAAYPSIRLLLRTYLSVISDGVSSKVHTAEFRFGTTAFTTRCVAVKSVFDAEYSVMREVGFLSECKHANVIELIGFYVDSVGTHIVTEFMPGGDLSNYLTNEQSHTTIREALSYGTQIAQAMTYLTKKHIIHGDLAARNCLLDEYQVTVKVGDFGMCRRSDEFYEYHTIKARLLPFAWCAPECVADVGKYSEKSDVWAFGVTLWEIFSRCSEPCGKGATCDDVLRHIKDGNRLQIPPSCPSEV